MKFKITYDIKENSLSKSEFLSFIILFIENRVFIVYTNIEMLL
jgi:hypothetical protein